MGSYFSAERFINVFPKIIACLSVNFHIVFWSMLLGTILAIFVAVLRLEEIPVVKQILSVYISFMRGTPLLVQMMIAFYGIPLVLGELFMGLFGINLYRIEPAVFVEIAIILNEGAFLGEIFRGAITSVPVLSQILAVFVTVYMGLPMMVAILLYNLLFMTFYNDVAGALHISVPISDVNPIYIGFFALILGISCSLSEAVRGAFRGIDKTQYEAGYSIGLTRFQTLIRVIFPKMVPILLPSLQNSLIGLLKASNLVSAIA